MATYYFDPQPAVDVTTSQLVNTEGLSGTLYDAQSGGNPVVAALAGGGSTSTITVSSLGLTQGFTTTDHPTVWWRSGAYTVRLVSFDGIVSAVDTSAAMAIAAAAAAAAAETAIATLRRWIELGNTRRNLAPDPRLTATVMSLNGATVTDTRPATGGPDDRSYMRRVVDVVGASPMNMPLTAGGLGAIPVTPGQEFITSWYARKSGAGGPGSRADWNWYDATGANLVALPTTTGAAKSITSSWVRHSQTVVVPEGAAYGRPGLVWTGAHVATQALDLAMALVESGTIMRPWFSGDSPTTNYVGVRWVAAANASISELLDMSTLVRTVNGMPGPDVTVAAGGGGGVTAHGALSGLGTGDDHPQYLNLARAVTQFWTRSQVDAMVTAAATQESTADRARANHTGTQAISTIVGLQPALDAAQGSGGGPSVVHFVVATADSTPRPAGAGMVIWRDARADQTEPPTNMGDNDFWAPGGVPSGDQVAPSIPTLLTKSSITASGFTLGWTASTDNVGITGYEVQRDGSVSLGVQTGTTRIITGLSPSSSYTFRVRARDAAGNTSPWSDPITVDTLASTDTVPPTVPTGLGYTGLTSSGFTVTWGAGTDNIGVTGYDVRINGGSWEAVAAEPRSKTFSGLTAQTAYTVGIRTRDAAGLTSGEVTLGVTTLEAAGEMYSVFGAGAPAGTWAWGTDGTPYIVASRGFRCTAAGARAVGGRAWVPAAASGSLPTEATFYLFGPDANLATTPVQTKVVSIAGATAGSWVEAIFDTPQTMEDGVWLVGVRFTGAGDAGKYAFGTGCRGSGSAVPSSGPLGEDLGWIEYSPLTAQIRIGTGGVIEAASNDHGRGVDILVDLEA